MKYIIKKNPSKKLSQKDKVFFHLFLHKTISSLEAIEEYGITRLGAIIYILRSEGHLIESTRDGRFAVYTLKIT